MIVNTSLDEIVLPKHRHLGEMKLFSASDDPVEPLMINEVVCIIDSDMVKLPKLKLLPAAEVHPPMTWNLWQNLNCNTQCHSNAQTGTPNWHKGLNWDKKQSICDAPKD